MLSLTDDRASVVDANEKRLIKRQTIAARQLALTNTTLHFSQKITKMHC